MFDSGFVQLTSYLKVGTTPLKAIYTEELPGVAAHDLCLFCCVG